MKYSLAEFFCGCGGTSRGFTRSGRFNVAFGNDVKAEALKTFEFNHRHDDVPPRTVRKDIRLLEAEEIHKALDERGVRKGDLDCMIGGPPCQGFSQMRRNEHRARGKIVKFSGYSQLSEDPRNDLVLRYLEVAEALQPKFLVIENVPQMLNHGFDGRLGHLSELVIQMLERDLGYKVEVAVVNCADYGVPQLRERAIFIASSIGSASLPRATHTDPKNTKLLASGLSPWVTVKDAISDLPNPSDQGDLLGGGSLDLYAGEASDYAKTMRTSAAFPYNHVTRAYRDSVLDIIKEMRPGQDWDTESARMRAKYEAEVAMLAKQEELSPDEVRELLIYAGEINPVFYKDYYWSAYTRLDWNSPALTITANANFLGSGRFTHPVHNRGITMREAARLQSFDDDFRLITSANDDLDTTRLGVGMDMIGEAVPPQLSQAIANHLAAQLDARDASAKMHEGLDAKGTVLIQNGSESVSANAEKKSTKKENVGATNAVV
ncbi:DNA cytosine methyltransferase [Herbaspirillum frisingense]|uniref:DNA cytosine methyltransferase n=1 Tax=Herbaspirillum frisingense TaxID=92645 RepID=UPI001F443B27|nr:DNA cytosine methyltransferase [Herbaspirillum frisingense]UIN20804.1 DNA cytosine methyltransferase [Herbaspirillum frisingense]